MERTEKKKEKKKKIQKDPEQEVQSVGSFWLKLNNRRHFDSKLFILTKTRVKNITFWPAEALDRNEVLLQSSFISTTADSIWTNKALDSVKWLVHTKPCVWSSSLSTPLLFNFYLHTLAFTDPDSVSCRATLRERRLLCDMSVGNPWPRCATSTSCSAFATI